MSLLLQALQKAAKNRERAAPVGAASARPPSRRTSRSPSSLPPSAEPPSKSRSERELAAMTRTCSTPAIEPTCRAATGSAFEPLAAVAGATRGTCRDHLHASERADRLGRLGARSAGARLRGTAPSSRCATAATSTCRSSIPPSCAGLLRQAARRRQRRRHPPPAPPPAPNQRQPAAGRGHAATGCPRSAPRHRPQRLRPSTASPQAASRSGPHRTRAAAAAQNRDRPPAPRRAAPPARARCGTQRAGEPSMPQPAAPLDGAASSASQPAAARRRQPDARCRPTRRCSRRSRRSAQALYEQVLQAEPQNIDALLGSGARSPRRSGNARAGHGTIQRVLRTRAAQRPAQAGLIAHRRRRRPAGERIAAEAADRARAIGLPVFHAGQSLRRTGAVAAAQQAYFQAYQLQPDNPDYAYNLAVGLEHLGQPKLALDLLPQGAANCPSRRATPTSIKTSSSSASASSPRA